MLNTKHQLEQKKNFWKLHGILAFSQHPSWKQHHEHCTNEQAFKKHCSLPWTRKEVGRNWVGSKHTHHFPPSCVSKQSWLDRREGTCFIWQRADSTLPTCAMLKLRGNMIQRTVWVITSFWAPSEVVRLFCSIPRMGQEKLPSYPQFWNVSVRSKAPTLQGAATHDFLLTITSLCSN